MERISIPKMADGDLGFRARDMRTGMKARITLLVVHSPGQVYWRLRRRRRLRAATPTAEPMAPTC